MADHCDVLIIGSGFGGAIPALELAQAGAKVILLERGPWRDTAPVRAAGIGERAPLPQGRHFLTHLVHRVQHRWLPRNGLTLHRHGLMEICCGDGANMVCSSGVGGGSHVYGGLHANPLQDDYWDNVADGVDQNTLLPHYEAVRTLLGSRMPDSSERQITWQRAGSDFVEVSPGQAPTWGYRQSTDFSREGSFGSPDGNKATLDAACLMPAMQHGLQVMAGHEVVEIRQLDDGRFAVTASHGERRFVTLQAARVIVAAGALNTVSLLLRSRAAGALRGMSALGQGFGTNADVMAWWPVNTPGANHPGDGVYQHLFRHRDDPLGPLFMQAGISGLAAMPLPGWLRRRLQRDLFIAAMGMDAADGSVTLERGRVLLHYRAANSPVFARISEHMQRIGALGGRRLHAPPTPTTVHPLGGARIGQTVQQAVINGLGEVHGIPGLYITDASALPAAPGSPPSLTIAAWARHVALGILTGQKR